MSRLIILLIIGLFIFLGFWWFLVQVIKGSKEINYKGKSKEERVMNQVKGGLY